MKRLILAVGLLLCASWPAWAADEDKITIGFLTSLSGPTAGAGQDMLDGFQLAVEHLIERMAGVEVELIVADDHQSPQAARQAVDKMIAKDKVDIVVAGLSARSLEAIVQPVTEARLHLISLTGAPADLTGQGCRPLFFSLSSLPESAHEAMGQYLRSKGYKRIFLMAPDTPAGHEAMTAFKRHHMGEVVGEIYSHRGEINFAKEMQKVAAAHPDALYMNYTGGMAVNAVRYYAEAGLKADIPLFGPWTMFDQTQMPGMGEAALDAYSTGFWAEDIDNPVNRRMVAEFDVAHGHPASSYAALGYDAAMLIDSAVRAVAGKIDNTDAMNAALAKADFVSVRGAFRFANNHFPVQTFILRQAVRDQRGRMGSETRSVVLRDYREPRAAECQMKIAPEPVLPAAADKRRAQQVQPAQQAQPVPQQPPPQQQPPQPQQPE